MTRSYSVGGVFGLCDLGLYAAVRPRDKGIGVLAIVGLYRARGPKFSRIFLNSGRPAVARSLREARRPLYRSRARFGRAKTLGLHLPQLE